MEESMFNKLERGIKQAILHAKGEVDEEKVDERREGGENVKVIQIKSEE